MKIDRKALYEGIEAKFPDPSFGENVNLLSRDCMKLAEEWHGKKLLKKDQEGIKKRP